MPRNREKLLAPVHPNIGVEMAYRRKLLTLVDEMNRSVVYWLKAAYRANEPVIGQDAPPDASGFPGGPSMPADELRRAMAVLRKRWEKKFDDAARAMAGHFARSAHQRSDAALKSILKKAGISVEFKLTSAQRDILKATVAENVALIKSIPAQYLTQVEGSVMRSVTVGRDLGDLTKELRDHFGVTRRRAAFIARDQNNKATAALTRARQQHLGIDEAVWVHSGGGKHPRPTHVKAGRDRTRYRIDKGWFDPAEKKYILPGELPNCRCVSRSVIPALG